MKPFDERRDLECERRRWSIERNTTYCSMTRSHSLMSYCISSSLNSVLALKMYSLPLIPRRLFFGKHFNAGQRQVGLMCVDGRDTCRDAASDHLIWEGILAKLNRPEEATGTRVTFVMEG